MSPWPEAQAEQGFNHGPRALAAQPRSPPLPSSPLPFASSPTRTNVKGVVDEKGADHEADEDEELDGPHAVLQAGAHVAAALHY